jgi:penicillin-binding protein 1A
MRLLLRGVLALLAVSGLVLALGLYWLFFYSRDLPDLDALSQFSPPATTTVTDKCYTTPITAVPYEAIGSNLRGALNSVEASEAGPTAYQQVSRALSDVRETRTALSTQIARTMFCSPEKSLVRRGKELRTALQLDRRFSRRDLFTIAANRYHFGSDLVGVQAASRYWFHKDPSGLSLPEAALLAGLVRAPLHYSPVAHPDRALARRNEVLDAMALQRVITTTEAEAAKSSPLNTTIP